MFRAWFWVVQIFILIAIVGLSVYGFIDYAIHEPLAGTAYDRIRKLMEGKD